MPAQKPEKFISVLLIQELCVKEPDNLVIKLLGQRRPLLGTKSINHGRKYEGQALIGYQKKHNEFCKGNIELEDKGLIVNPGFPFLGANSLVICDVFWTEK